jgi:PST family polysaccharide transporter
MFSSIGATVGIIYQAKGRTDWLFKWGLFTGVIRFSCFVIGLNWGLMGITLAYTISSGILLYHNFSIPFQLIKLPMLRFINVLWKTLICSLFMLYCIWLVQAYLPIGLSPIWVLSINIPIGVSTYLGLSWLINREKLKELIFSALQRSS